MAKGQASAAAAAQARAQAGLEQLIETLQALHRAVKQQSEDAAARMRQHSGDAVARVRPSVHAAAQCAAAEVAALRLAAESQVQVLLDLLRSFYEAHTTEHMRVEVRRYAADACAKAADAAQTVRAECDRAQRFAQQLGEQGAEQVAQARAWAQDTAVALHARAGAAARPHAELAAAHCSAAGQRAVDLAAAGAQRGRALAAAAGADAALQQGIEVAQARLSGLLDAAQTLTATVHQSVRAKGGPQAAARAAAADVAARVTEQAGALRARLQALLDALADVDFRQVAGDAGVRTQEFIGQARAAAAQALETVSRAAAEAQAKAKQVTDRGAARIAERGAETREAMVQLHEWASRSAAALGALTAGDVAARARAAQPQLYAAADAAVADAKQRLGAVVAATREFATAVDAKLREAHAAGYGETATAALRRLGDEAVQLQSRLDGQLRSLLASLQQALERGAQIGTAEQLQHVQQFVDYARETAARAVADVHRACSALTARMSTQLLVTERSAQVKEQAARAQEWALRTAERLRAHPQVGRARAGAERYIAGAERYVKEGERAVGRVCPAAQRKGAEAWRVAATVTDVAESASTWERVETGAHRAAAAVYLVLQAVYLLFVALLFARPADAGAAAPAAEDAAAGDAHIQQYPTVQRLQDEALRSERVAVDGEAGSDCSAADPMAS